MSTDPHDRSGRRAKIDAAAPRRSRTRSVLIPIVAVVAVLAVVGAIWLGVRSNQGANDASGGSASNGSQSYPKGATGPTGGYLVTTNAKQGAPTLDLYEDFQCPSCKAAETAVGPTIKKMAADGEVKVVYHMKTFLDGNLRNDSSTRAALAAACVADAGKFQAFHDTVFANQPAQEGQGYTDDQLKQYAQQAGVTGDALTTWQSCYSSKKYAGYVKGVEETTAQEGVNSTPTFRVNGKDLDLSQVQDAAGFRTAVLQAGGAASSGGASS